MKSRWMKGKRGSSFCLTLWSLDCSILIIPNFNCFIFASSNNNRLSNTNIHSHYRSRMKVKIYLLQMSPNIILQIFISHFTLKHQSIRHKSKYFIIVRANASYFYFFFGQLKSAFSLIHAFFKTKESNILTADSKTFCPITD